MVRQVLKRIWQWLPRGGLLSDEVWSRRHMVIVALLWLEVVAVIGASFWADVGLGHAIQETAAPGAFAVLALMPIGGRAVRSGIAALGLLMGAGVLTHLSGGLIEMHFLFFVIVGLITLYQDWRPFLLSVGFVAIHHGMMGALDPDSVYNHPDAIANPWKWAAIHAGFILAMSAVCIVAWKLTEEMHAAVELSEARFRGHFEHAAVGEALVDLDGKFVAVNPALCTMLGYTEAELLALDVQTLTHADDRDRSARQLERVVSGEVPSYDIEKRYVRKDQEVVHCLLSVSAIRDADGNVVHTTGVMQDITERNRAEQALQHQALHDSLTGLPNRSLVVDRINGALSRGARANAYTAVLFLDIDRFKWVNDSLGHAAGDEILLNVASRLQVSLRSGDTVARFGGDEFVVLCEQLETKEEAILCVERITEALREPVVVADREVPVTVSTGIAVAAPGDAHSPEALLSEADAAMYRAKDRGRNRYEIFDTTMKGRAHERFETENELRRAIECPEIVAHYQPVVSISTGEVVGVEALARWEHPTRGLLAPADFIPIAEETGLVIPLGNIMLERACHDVAAWNAEHPEQPLSVSVNVSPRQLATGGVPGAVTAALNVSGLDPARLCLEITENALLDDLASNALRLRALEDLGVSLAVDDFGTGYSSLLYLKQFPLDVLKIDRLFTAGVGLNDDDTAIVGAVIGLAQTLGLTSVAEGVETAEQLAALSELACDHGQGFYWKRPVPFDDLQRWMLGSPVHRLAPTPA